ncbi:MAG: hypothetical protein P4K83_04150 [Terracidiphilus sp.]|nr:hypothetical protein [Terracidiphilus sp.]
MESRRPLQNLCSNGNAVFLAEKKQDVNNVRAIVHIRRKRLYMRMMKLATRSVLCVTIMLAAVYGLHASETKIASGHSHGVTVSIVNESGKFVTGSNDFRVVFTTAPDAMAASMKDVDVEFSPQTGKIHEKSVHAQITKGDAAYFYGKVDLGAPYYRPAFYYVFIHYTDQTGARRRCRLSLAIRLQK